MSHAIANETPVVFQNEGANLVGILTRPAGSGAPRVGIVTAHGWSGYRIGPHGIVVDFARRAAELGYPSLRFDFRGRGDSEGEMEQANRASMIADCVCATSFLREQTGCERVVLVGICAGSQVAIGAAAEGARPDALLLWSAPLSEQTGEEQAVAAKRRHFLGEYARKLCRPETWRKLVTGKLQPKKIAHVLSGQQGRAAEDDRAVDLRCAARLADFGGPILFVYGTHDPITGVALPYYQRILAQRKEQVSVRLIEGANHSFYGTEWREQVLRQSLTWLQERFGGA